MTVRFCKASQENHVSEQPVKIASKPPRKIVKPRTKTIHVTMLIIGAIGILRMMVIIGIIVIIGIVVVIGILVIILLGEKALVAFGDQL